MKIIIETIKKFRQIIGTCLGLDIFSSLVSIGLQHSIYFFFFLPIILMYKIIQFKITYFYETVQKSIALILRALSEKLTVSELQEQTYAKLPKVSGLMRFDTMILLVIGL
jgi:hypothetical protein